MAKANDILSLITDYLDNNGLDNVKCGMLPATPNNCIALIGLPGSQLDDRSNVTDLKMPRFQVIVRNTDYETGADNLKTIRTLLHNKHGLLLPVSHTNLPYVRVMYIMAEQEGGPIGQDDNGRFEFSINFELEYHNVDT